MDFKTFCKEFNTLLHRNITRLNEKHFEQALKMFEQFKTFEADILLINKDDFLKSVSNYMVFVHTYVRISQKITSKQHFKIRMAFQQLLSVVDIDKEQFLPSLCTLIVRMIQITPRSGNALFNLKEFLRLYCFLLDEIFISDKNNMSKFCIKYKFSALEKIIYETSDIELQTMIIILVLKLHKFVKNTHTSKSFLALLQKVNVATLNDLNLYPNVRMALDKINKNSSKIFSINCSAIKMENERILEFEGASYIDDIWLDVNILQKQLSFFCNRKFASLISKTEIRMFYNWEVLSFSANDVIKSNFDYNSLTEQVNISLVLPLNSFTLFGNYNSSIRVTLLISVSKYADKFSLFVKKIIPALFPNILKDIDNLIDKEFEKLEVVEVLDSDEDDDSVLVSRDIISAKSTIHISTTVSDHSEPFFKGWDTQKIGTSCDLLETEDTSNVVKKNKCSKPVPTNYVSGSSTKMGSCLKSTNNKFNRSISPVSFTESMVAKAICVPSSSSESEDDTVCKKISTVAIVHIPPKSSGQSSNGKISSSLMSSIINLKPKLQSEKGTNENLNLLEGIRNCSVNLNFDRTMSKVENWLNRLESDDSNELKIDVPNLPSPAVSVLQNLDSSPEVLPPEKKMELLMTPIEENRSSNVSVISNKSVTTTTLINILDSESGKNLQPDAKKSLNTSTRSNELQKSKKNNSSDDSNVPLIKISKKEKTKLKKQRKEKNEKDEARRRHRDKFLIVKEISPHASKKNVDLSFFKHDANGIMNQQKKCIKKTKLDVSDLNLSEIAQSAHETHVQLDITNKSDSSISKEKIHETKTSVNKETSLNFSDLNNNAPNDDLENNPLLSPQKYINIDPFSLILNVSEENCLTEGAKAQISQKEEIYGTTYNKDSIKKQSNMDKIEIIKKSPNMNNNNLTTTKTIANTSLDSNASKKMKRKLYNPNDLSYLNKHLTDAYLNSTDNVLDKIKSTQIANTTLPFRKKKTPRTSANRNRKAVLKTKPRNSSLRLTRKDLFTSAHKVTNESKGKELFDNLKQRVNRRKNMKKELNAGAGTFGSSSSSSFEPLASISKNMRVKRKSSTIVKRDTNETKRSKYSDVSCNILVETIVPKINILSNVLLKAGEANNVECCCTTMAESLNQTYFNFITHANSCKPELLNSRECKNIGYFLANLKN